MTQVKGLKPLTQIGHAFVSARIKKQLDRIRVCTKAFKEFGVTASQSDYAQEFAKVVKKIKDKR